MLSFHSVRTWTRLLIKTIRVLDKKREKDKNKRQKKKRRLSTETFQKPNMKYSSRHFILICTLIILKYYKFFITNCTELVSNDWTNYKINVSGTPIVPDQTDQHPWSDAWDPRFLKKKGKRKIDCCWFISYRNMLKSYNSKTQFYLANFIIFKLFLKIYIIFY